MKVLLIAPPSTIPIGMSKRCMPPLGLCYVASAAIMAGHDVEMLDCTVDGYYNEITDEEFMRYGLSDEDIEARLAGIDYDLLGISVRMSNDYWNVLKIAEISKCVRPKSQVMVGGLHPSLYPMDFHNPNIDSVHMAEGETAFHNFRTFSGRIDNLDALPSPAFSLLPMEEYFRINVPFSPVPRGKRVMPMLATRGCPMGCGFCANTNFLRKHITRTAYSVMQEVEWYKTIYAADEIQFADDNLNFNGEFFGKMLVALGLRKIRWCTPNGVMVNRLDKKLVESMAEAGCYQITISVDDVTKRKKSDLGRVRELIECARENRMFTHGTFVIGMPGDTMEEIYEGFKLIRKTMPFTSVTTFIAFPIPGSKIYNEGIEKRWFTKERAFKINTNKYILPELNAKEVESAVKEFQQEFNEECEYNYPDEVARKYGGNKPKGRLA